MSYGADIPLMSRHAADYVAKILQGGEASRSSGRASCDVRTGNQSQDREGARPHRAAATARARRRGDRIASAQMRLLVTGLKELFWLSCLMLGILFMIAAATEGFPFTSIHIRGEFWQDAIGGLGLFLALLGVYVGFAVGKTKGK